MTGSERFRSTLSATLALLLVATLLASIATWIEQAYSPDRYPWTMLFLLDRHLRWFAPTAFWTAAAWFLLGGVWTRRVGAARGAAGLGAVTATLLVALPYLYRFNRDADISWSLQRRWLGLALPGWLWEGRHLLWNLGLVAAFAAGGWLLARILASVFGRWNPTPFWRRLGRLPTVVVFAACVALLLGGAWARRVAVGASRPNIVLISLDTLRADHLGCYGYARDTSPVIDSLATVGTRFEWCIAQACWTLPSHMSLFTALYVSTHDVDVSTKVLPGARTTLTESLCEAGYRTGGFTDGAFVRGNYGFSQGFEVYDDVAKGMARSVPAALRWLDGFDRREPFFLFLHSYDVHDPYDPPAPWRERYLNSDDRGGFDPSTENLSAIRRRCRDDPAAAHGLSPDDIARMIALYDAGVAYADHWVGQLVNGLRDRKRLDDTWIVLTSDHGEEFTEHGSVLHDRLYHTVTHVPLILVPPADDNMGKRATVGEVVELVDLSPTLLEVAGARPIPGSEGATLTPLLSAGETDYEGRAFAESRGYGGARSITTDEIHVVDAPARGPAEGFSYREDRLEQLSIAEGDPLQATVGELVEILDAWQARLRSQRGEEATSTRELTGAESEQLRALGYVD